MTTIAMRQFAIGSSAVLIALSLQSSAYAVAPDQLDDFESGTEMQWTGNMLGNVTAVPAGGPNGAGDGYLQTSITQFPFHLGTKNQSQWKGNYLAAGIDAIEIDLNDLSSTRNPIQVRLLIFGFGGTFASVQRTPPLPRNVWTHHVFGLTSDDLVHVGGGTGNLDDTLSGVTTLLIRNDRDPPTLPGRHPPHILGTLGIDNIRAVPLVPDTDGDGIDDDHDLCPLDPLNDADGDGVCGNEDACPDSDMSATVTIGYCDSGVLNGPMGDGCTLADLITESVEDCAAGAKNDGQFVRCVARALREYKSSGIISGKEYGALVSCAARADKQ